MLARFGAPGFSFFAQQLGALNQPCSLRLVGYALGSESFYAPLQLTSAFDAVLFLRSTTAATPLP